MKNEVIELLKERKYVEMLDLSSSKNKVLNTLISLSYDKKTLVSWLAIEAIGRLTKEISKSNPDIVRDTVNRLLWMIRDESGGIGWSAPEILGEIVRNNPELCSDITTIIVSFLNEPPLRAGVLRAIGRMEKSNAEMVEYAIPLVMPYLQSPDPMLRGYAAWALGEIGASGAVNELEKLKNDNNPINFYEDGELKEKTVGELTAAAVAKLKSH